LALFTKVVPWNPLRLFFPAELVEARIFAQWIPERIDLKIADGFAVRYFKQMRQGSDRTIDIAGLRLDDCQ
jgi:hypothetical protein